MRWITNHPKSHKGLIPRRVGVTYYDGEPKATEKYSVEDFKKMGYVGVYVDITDEEYKKFPLGNPYKK